MFAHNLLEKVLVAKGLLVLFERSELEVDTWALDSLRALEHFSYAPFELTVAIFVEVVVLLVASPVVNEANLTSVHLEPPLGILGAKPANFIESAPHTAYFVSPV